VILAPYTQAKQHPTAKALLERHAPGDITWALIPERDDTAYARILVEAWAEPGPLVIVEHDVGIRAGVVEELLGCDQPWCGFPYAIGESLLVCLGCTKFSAHLKAMQPGLMAEAAAIDSAQDGGGVPAGDWRRMDVRIGACLERLGHNRHRHEPAVDHFHQYA
jgi:hypothetical protein